MSCDCYEPDCVKTQKQFSFYALSGAFTTLMWNLIGRFPKTPLYIRYSGESKFDIFVFTQSEA